ncbi:MAG: DUF748 domain-containing protein [Azonexus sp.]|jgi:hypothetical protein|nr:DUF748 domain-containing protein [Azonexus sp.]
MAETLAGSQNGVSRWQTLLSSRRIKRLGLWTLVIVVAFGLFGYFAAPPIARSVLVKQLSELLHREVAIDKVAINPYALSAEIDGLSVKAADGREVAGFDALAVNLSSASLFKAALVIDAIRVDGLRLEVVHEGDGRYDISDLIDEWSQPSAEPSSTPRFSLNNIELNHGRVVFDDRPKGVRHELSDINLGLPFLSSLPYQAEVLVQPHFSARADGSLIEMQGQSTPFAETRESELNLKIDAFKLAAVEAYLPPTLPLQIKDGQFDADLKIIFKEVSASVFSLAVQGGAKISALAVHDKDGPLLLGWQELAVDLDQADLINRRIAVRRVALSSPEVGLAVNRQGQLNLLALLDRLAGSGGQAAKAEAAGVEGPPLAWSLGEFTLDNGLVRWQDASNARPVAGELRQLRIKTGPVDSALTKPIEITEISGQPDFGDALRAERLSLSGISLDLAAQRIEIGEIANQGTRIRILRDKVGSIAWLTPPALKTASADEAKAKAGEARPWAALVKRLDVSDLAVRFEDRGSKSTAVQELTDLALTGENLGTEKDSKGRIDFAGLVNKKGKFKIDGEVRLEPLDLALNIDTQAIQLLPLQPYFADYLDAGFKNGQFSNQGAATASLDGGKLKLAYRGSATLGNLQLVDKVNKTDFLRWKSLYFGGIDFKLEPLAVDIGEIALSDFFARVILSEQGRLNLQDIIRSQEAAPPSATASAASDAKPAAAPPPVKIAKVTLQNGAINFTDRFVKPNYNVNVSKLTGRVTGLSSTAGTTADLDLRAAYAKSAPVQIQGKLNPLAAKSFLDLKASVKGVDLTGFSTYSGKYAGYAIAKGTLSLDLAYKLENQQLTASNKVFIDQFTFGEPVESPDATQLPVNLALALLKNNKGEIDVELPISGSLDDPEFSFGGIVLRVIGNLIVKAVTSPFALLGSMFGDDEELSKVDFEPGRARISESRAHALETLAKALNERQGLKLDISGLAEPETDREGLKEVALERAIRAECRQNKAEAAAPDQSELTAAERLTCLTAVYKAAKFPKPRNVVGFQKDLPAEEMEKLILANTTIGDEDIGKLARQRAENVRAWLTNQGHIAPDRLFLVAPKTDATPGARVDFALK